VNAVVVHLDWFGVTGFTEIESIVLTLDKAFNKTLTSKYSAQVFKTLLKNFLLSTYLSCIAIVI